MRKMLKIWYCRSCEKKVEAEGMGVLCPICGEPGPGHQKKYKKLSQVAGYRDAVLHDQLDFRMTSMEDVAKSIRTSGSG